MGEGGGQIGDEGSGVVGICIEKRRDEKRRDEKRREGIRRD